MKTIAFLMTLSLAPHAAANSTSDQLKSLIAGLELMRVSAEVKTDLVDSEFEVLSQLSYEDVSLDLGDFVLEASSDENTADPISISFDSSRIDSQQMTSTSIWTTGSLDSSTGEFQTKGDCNIYPRGSSWQQGITIACFFEAKTPRYAGEHLQVLFLSRAAN